MFFFVSSRCRSCCCSCCFRCCRCCCCRCCCYGCCLILVVMVMGCCRHALPFVALLRLKSHAGVGALEGKPGVHEGAARRRKPAELVRGGVRPPSQIGQEGRRPRTSITRTIELERWERACGSLKKTDPCCCGRTPPAVSVRDGEMAPPPPPLRK